MRRDDYLGDKDCSGLLFGCLLVAALMLLVVAGFGLMAWILMFIFNA